jgi:hypothetical protein
MALTKLTNEAGYLKAGFLGFAKSGKSFTAAKLAIGTIKLFKLDGPVALFDSESGSNFISEMVKAETGKDLMGVRARSFDSLMQFARDCIAEKVSVAIIDSITHPWVELCDSYLAQLNDSRKAKGWAPLQKLEFAQWASIKKIWEQWPNFFLNSPLHVILCGRAGYEWEMTTNEETGRKELEKTGIKMKTEKELGFEPSLLVQMERDQVPDGHGGFKMVHIATVLGDRFNVIDGATATNPDFGFFQPHVEKLRPGAHAPVDVVSKTATGATVEGGDWDREKKLRTILCEEVQGAIVSKYPGQSAEDKKQKADLLQLTFNTRSWTKVESMTSDQLRDGLTRLRKHLGIDLDPVSTSETDELDFGKIVQEASGPPPATSTQPEAQNVVQAISGDAAAALAKLRAVMAAQGGLGEPDLVQLLINLGSVSPGTKTLEEVAQVKPGLLNVVAEAWGTYVNAAQNWLQEEKK